MNEEICGREKYWSELNDSEKIERMRNQVKSLQEEAKRLRELIFKLLVHKHLDGEIVIPVDSGKSGVDQVRRTWDPDKVYF